MKRYNLVSNELLRVRIKFGTKAFLGTYQGGVAQEKPLMLRDFSVSSVLKSYYDQISIPCNFRRIKEFHKRVKISRDM